MTHASPELTARYLALPTMKLSDAARLLGCSVTSIGIIRRAEGIKTSLFVPQPEEDRRLVAAYLALPADTSHNHAAVVLQIGVARLEGALLRTGTGRRARQTAKPPQTLSRAVSEDAPKINRNRPPLPAGSPETWGVLGWGAYPDHA